MRPLAGKLRLTATDLSNHLACRHLTTLDLEVARGTRPAPPILAPDLKVIQELGLRHERNYLTYLENDKKLAVVNLKDIRDEKELLEQTRRLMAQGADAIAQGALGDGEWFGRPDVLLRLAKPSGKWLWSYEVVDTKLTRDTKAGSILQLSLYSELLAKVQGSDPEFLWVVPPGNFAGEPYRVSEYAAYYRYVKSRLASVVKNGNAYTYPEPVEHCNICRWFLECDARRRSDDHLSLVAGIRRLQRDQLEDWNAATMTQLAVLPLPIQQWPEHGSKAGYERIREQARVQVQGRIEDKLIHEAILPVTDGTGFFRLPEPSANDLFLDFEGDPFAGPKGLQYLFGFAWRDANGNLQYDKRWAFNAADEKLGFQWLIDEIMRRLEADPKMHVYHFGAYEPSTLKHLMGTHATREDEVDRLLRAGTLVDLHQTFKQGLRASVEEYSLKKLEAFCGFERKTPLDASRGAMRYVEHRLELGWGDQELPEEIREIMEAYNREDCFATAQLRDWLEAERLKVVQRGSAITRPPEKSGDPSEKLEKRLDAAAALTERLTNGISPDPNARTPEQSAQWLLAQLLSWHRREDKRAWQEGFRLADLTDEELLDERVGLTRMRFDQRIEHVRRGTQVPTDRYFFDPQRRSNVKVEDDLYYGDEKFGCVVFINHADGVVHIKKTKKSADLHLPTVYAWKAPLASEAQADSLYRLGSWVAKNPIDAPGPYRAGRDLLLRKPPRLFGGEKLQQLASETVVNTATRIVLALDNSTFAIQGPPGSGKTFTGARMICELVKRGKKVGITALSHKVIRKLLDDVVEAAHELDMEDVRCLHRDNEGEESDGVEVARKDNEEAWSALETGSANVLGGTSWLWSPEPAFEIVDVLFIDEAGQMSLADVVAVSQAAKKLVLLGDPQQLERPTKGSHPDGAEVSALEHLLNDRKTIPPDMGFLLPETWRLHPKVCKFTSEFFYDAKLRSHALTRSRVLEGHPWLKEAGLWFIGIEHEGNRNSSAEEVELIARIVDGLLKPEVKWFYSAGNSRSLKQDEILIVAPYNAQVADLKTRLPNIRVGTVDKFQGQEAPVVIYSLTTSSPQEAPRGMEFLYSLNRLNVATSRAKTAVIVVGSPKLFEPECRTPRQMQLANALCGFREMATEIKPDAI